MIIKRRAVGLPLDVGSTGAKGVQVALNSVGNAFLTKIYSNTSV